MINTMQFLDRLKTFISSQIDSLSTTSPMINFIKPLIMRVLDKNLNKIVKFTDLVSDDNGNIDVEGIISEMIESVMTSNPFVINTSLLGNVEIGSGNIKFIIPFTDKQLIFNQTDLENLKRTLTSN